MIKIAKEALTSESTTQEFVVELAKNIASFIVFNRTAFSQEDKEAVSEYLTASTLSEVKEKVLEFIAEPNLLQEDGRKDVQKTPKSEEEPEEELEVDSESEQLKKAADKDDLVPDEILKMIDD